MLTIPSFRFAGSPANRCSQMTALKRPQGGLLSAIAQKWQSEPQGHFPVPPAAAPVAGSYGQECAGGPCTRVPGGYMGVYMGVYMGAWWVYTGWEAWARVRAGSGINRE